LEYVVLVLFLSVMGISLFTAWRRRQPTPPPDKQTATPSGAPPAQAGEPAVAASEPKLAPSEPALAPSEPAVVPGEPDDPDPDELDAILATGPSGPPPLADQLQELGQGIESAGASAAHPRELFAQANFERAIGLLADAEAELDTVVRYALSHDWGLACAALAALDRREGGQQVVDRVLAHLGWSHGRCTLRSAISPG
jgi:hypothetical protein